MNGMTSAPVGRQGTKTLHTSDDQGVTSSHVVPVEQFIHYIDKNGTCLCGPLVDYVEVGGPDRHERHPLRPGRRVLRRWVGFWPGRP
jgi:hypothetical protein